MASKKILIQVDVTTKSAEVQINKVVDSINKLEGATARLKDTTKKSRAQSGLNNAILIESGRFASDLRFGFTAVANNLGRIIELGQEFSRTEGGGLLPALRRIFTAQGLFLIGFQLIVAYGDKIFEFFNKLIGRTESLSESFEKVNSSIGDSAGKFEIYIRTLQDSNKSQEEQLDAIDALNEEFPEYIKRLEEAGLTIEDVKNKTEEAEKQNKLQREEIKRLAMARAAQSKIEEEASKLIQIAIDEELQKREILQKRQEEINKQNETFAKIELLREKQRTEGLSYFENARLSNLEDRYDDLSSLRENTIKGFDDELAALKDSNDKERKLIEDRINSLLEFTDIQTGETNKNIDNNLKLVSSVRENTQGEFDGLLEYLQGKGAKTQEILQKIIEGQSIEQIKASMEIAKSGERALKGAGDAGVQALADLAKADDKYTKNRSGNSKILKKLNDEERKERNRQLTEIAGNLNKAAGLFGENTSANKTMKIASAIINTYAGANEALAGPVPLNFINAAAVIAAGLANVQKIKSIKVPKEKGSASTPAPPNLEAPDFNVVGVGGVSQIATTLAGVTGQPLKAFVVSKEISSAQELERNITSTASIG